MLKENKQEVKAFYNQLKQYICMFGSFFLLSLFVYVFHVVQAAILYRTYVTGIAIVVCGFGIKQDYDKRSKYLWASACTWFVYSIVYFDIRTHIQTLYWVIMAAFSMFPFFSWKRLYEGRWGVLHRALYWIYVFSTPSLYANVYGNALYSIVKLLSVVILILTDPKESTLIEYYSWPLFCHPIWILIVPFQIVWNLLPRFSRSTSHESPAVTKVKNDIIGYNDVPFLFKGGRKASV